MLSKIKNFFLSRRGVIVLIIIAIVVFFVTRRGNDSDVKTATVEKADVIATLVLPGEVKAKQDVILTFPASGKMTAVNVVEGQKVTKGAFLGQMDTTVLNAVYQEALSTRRNTQAAVDKVHDDLKDKGTSETFAEKSTRTAAEVANDQAWDALLIAKKNLHDATFISPIDGVVSKVGVKTVGSSVTASTIAFEVVNPNGLYFSVTADQTESGRIMPGQEVEITLDAFDGQTLKASVEGVSLTPNPDETDTVYDVSISSLDVDDVKGQVRVGMTGDATLIIDKKENVVSLDSSFIKTDLDGKYVLKGTQKEKVKIQIGLEGEDKTEILSGLVAGDVVYQK